jgi:VWFA-related protein
MRANLRITGAVLFASMLGGGLMAQMRPVYQVVVSADPVKLDVAVSDDKGKAITGLEPQDFTILEDGQPQQLGTFDTVGIPYSILVLVDRSPKESKNKWPDFILKSVDLFLRNLRGPDRLAVAAFDTRVAVLVDWRPTRNGMTQRVMLRHSEQPTRFFEAMNWAVEEMKYVAPLGVPDNSSGFRGRKGVIVFTDGRDREMYPEVMHQRGRDIVDPNYTVPEVVEERFRSTRATLAAGRLPFYFVAVDTDRQVSETSAAAKLEGWMRFLTEVRLRVEQLAAASGGRATFPRTIEDLLPLYTQIHRELGSGYQITYTPQRPPDGKTRRIEIRVNRENASVYQSHDTYQPR